ncbi:MAG TPA: restriction endonuclease subunit S [bacterium]|nr:restriction endonuclease subunit S [bacterium]
MKEKSHNTQMGNDNIKVPEGWKRVRLGEVLKYEQPTKYLVKNENYDKNSGIPVLTPGKTLILGYTEEKFGIFENLPVIIFDDFTTESKYINFPFKLKSSAIKILNAKNEENNLYVAYNALQILNFKPGSEHKRFWISEFSKFQILLPPLPEQRKIAEILETVDRAIEKTDQIIEKYRRIKQGLMQDLLTRGIDENGKIRSEKTHKFKNSPLGRIPEEWEVVRLGEVAFVTKLAGFEYTKFFNYSLEGEIILIRALNIRDGKLDLSNTYTMPKDISVKLNRSKLDKNDIVISYVGTVGECAIIPFDDKFHLAPNVAKVSIRKNDLMPEFILKYLLGFHGKREINLIMSSTTQSALSMSNIRTIRVLLPPLPEQQRIAEILSQVDNTIEKEEAYKQKLERIKKGLMEDLLTGKVRVNHLITENDVNVHQT